MTIREKLEEIVTKIKTDDMLAAKFKVAPVKTLEELLGVNLPDEQVKAAVEAIRAKLDGEKVDKIPVQPAGSKHEVKVVMG